MTPRSASAEVTAHQTRLIAGGAAQHHPLFGEVVSVAGLLGAITRGAGKHTEAAALAARVLRPGHLQGQEVTGERSERRKVMEVTAMGDFGDVCSDPESV